MQCGSPSQNDRLSKKLTAIEQRLEDILMRISQESGSTEARLRDLNSIAKLTTTVTTCYNQLTNDCGNGSSFSKLGALAKVGVNPCWTVTWMWVGYESPKWQFEKNTKPIFYRKLKV